jgi:hypothetical protein
MKIARFGILKDNGGDIRQSVQYHHKLKDLNFYKTCFFLENSGINKRPLILTVHVAGSGTRWLRL